MASLLPKWCKCNRVVTFCSAVSIGSRLIFFGGGGAISSNKFVFADIAPVVSAGITTPVQPDVTSAPPSPSSPAAKQARHEQTTTSPSRRRSSKRVIQEEEPIARFSARLQIASNVRTHTLASPSRHSKSTSSNSSRSGSGLPSPRCSAIMARHGRYLIIHGGWSRRTNEVGDIWVRSVVYRTTPW
jgi:hypothetical protein